MVSLLTRLFGRQQPTAPIAAIPPGCRVYAIGDVHGRLDLLDDLLDRIAVDDRDRPPADTQIIFLGDLIDRGPESRGVVDRAMAMAVGGINVRFLMGNHEEVLLAALKGRQGAMRQFIRIGGGQTLHSYGITGSEYRDADFDELVELARARIPAEHVEFLAGFEDRIGIGDYLFVHAGIRPGIPLDKQRPSDLRWIREEFVGHAGNHGRIIVHGHTVTDHVEERPNRIGIDTGAFASGRLTALALEGSERWYLTGALPV
ncbi:metallophosphoesterase family protein [Sphingomonas sp. MMS24-J13]|uniref:metallophosphoesterase family protein n=1 Tax=Sphingomonas sp. MMS24-J13 TaxID=3238686 RepID=UPI003850EFB5